MHGVGKLLGWMFCALLVFSGCAGNYRTSMAAPEAAGGPGRYVAVLPMVNLTTYPNAGRIVGDLLQTELYAVPGLKFLERSTMNEALAGMGLDPDQDLDRTAAQRVGRKLGVDAVVFGSVSEYLYKRGLDQSPSVGVNLRLLDVETGKILWAAGISRSGSCLISCDGSLNALAQEVCAELARSLAAALAGKGS